MQIQKPAEEKNRKQKCKDAGLKVAAVSPSSPEMGEGWWGNVDTKTARQEMES